MPELPEVETLVRELNRTVQGKTIRTVTTDSPKLIRPLPPQRFRRAIAGRRFLDFTRRGKFILVRLSAPRSRPGASRSGSVVLLWHMGMTGHPLYRDPAAEAVDPRLASAMADPWNRHVRLTFHFTDGTRLEYADVRKFGKLEFLGPPERAAAHPQLQKLGPDVLALANNPLKLCARLKMRNGPLKMVLMDQAVVAGVGNIYADEALWGARLHPLFPTARLTVEQCRVLGRALSSVLREAIRAHGTSVDDFRRLRGNKGAYGDIRRAYQRTRTPCARCGTLIERLVVGGRGTHICPRCQVRAPADRVGSKTASRSHS